MKKIKRSQQKLITRETTILRYMRMSKKLSMKQAGAFLNFSDSAISHIEQGRMDLHSKVVKTLVPAYGFTMEEFNEYLAGKPLPVLSLKDECLQLIEGLEEGKMRAIHTMLVSFIR